MKQKKGMGPQAPHAAHKRPQCGRFKDWLTGVINADFWGRWGRFGEETPVLSHK